ncbi:unnamed protein product [Owenia fusiformis]|uniref:Uncharacterized protein n=1 Tax=Owenia fusiformis TaxID=6347 RepID=A0A8J1UQU1_OWEFU|nr:unnamed protein product [Owenia fusiformis]
MSRIKTTSCSAYFQSRTFNSNILIHKYVCRVKSLITYESLCHVAGSGLEGTTVYLNCAHGLIFSYEVSSSASENWDGNSPLIQLAMTEQGGGLFCNLVICGVDVNTGIPPISSLSDPELLHDAID